jgi:hypothetical protein
LNGEEQDQGPVSPADEGGAEGHGPPVGDQVLYVKKVRRRKSQRPWRRWLRRLPGWRAVLLTILAVALGIALLWGTMSAWPGAAHWFGQPPPGVQHTQPKFEPVGSE